jgi:autotransporter-associated beta strand protein
VDNTNATAITLTTGGNNTSTTFSGVIQDTGGNLTFTKTGTGTQTLSGTAANTFAGNLNVNDGTLALGKTAGVNAYAGSTINIGDGAGAADSAVLRLDASNQIINTAALVFASDGRLDLNGQAETVASIAGSGEIAIGTGQLTAGNALNTVFSGELTGTTGTFTKTGSGTLTLASTINYDGVFELAAGTLSLSGITANIGTLTLTGNSTIDFAGASILNVANLNLNGFTLNITNWTNATDYFFAANWSGAVTDTTGVAPMNQVTFNGFAASDTKWQGYDSQVTPVPEPATYGALLLGGMMAAFGIRRFLRRG